MNAEDLLLLLFILLTGTFLLIIGPGGPEFIEGVLALRGTLTRFTLILSEETVALRGVVTRFSVSFSDISVLF